MATTLYSSTFASFMIAFLVFLGTSGEAINPGKEASKGLIEKTGSPIENTIEIYDTFPCETCQRYARESISAIKQQAAEQSLANLFVYLIPRPADPTSELGVLAAKCASLQQKFWEAHSALHAMDSNITRRSVESMGRDLSLKMDDFRTCLDENPFAGQTEKEQEKAITKSIDAWPTTLAGQYRLRGYQPPENVIHYMKKSLKRLTPNL